MKGTILYQCRICGHEDIPISNYVESIYCPTCNKKIELIQTSREYLREIFTENGVAIIGQNATQTHQDLTGCTKKGRK